MENLVFVGEESVPSRSSIEPTFPTSGNVTGTRQRRVGLITTSGNSKSESLQQLDPGKLAQEFKLRLESASVKGFQSDIPQIQRVDEAQVNALENTAESLPRLNSQLDDEEFSHRQQRESVNSYQLKPWQSQIQSNSKSNICETLSPVKSQHGQELAVIQHEESASSLHSLISRSSYLLCSRQTTPAESTSSLDQMDNTSFSTHGSQRRSISADLTTHHHDPTSEKDKGGWFYLSLTESLCLIYAIMLVTIGILIYVADVILNARFVYAESYNLYLIIVQLVFLIYIHIDARQYINLISRELKKAEKNEVETRDRAKSDVAEVIPQYYGFTTGRHGGSLYLKIGTAVFCFGYMIQGGLELGQKIMFVTADSAQSSLCTNAVDLVVSAIRPLYVFYKLFFIFKFSNLIINRKISISKFGIMHCGGSSLCFWLYNIVQQIAYSISSTRSDGIYTSNDTVGIQPLYEETDQRKWTLSYGCDQETHLTDVLNTLKPYLFPFSIEFNIMMIGFWILLWENLGRIDRHTHIPSIEITYEDGEDNDKSLISNLIIYVDCHASLRGLFLGLLVIVGTVLSTILFFVFSANESTSEMGTHVTIYSELIVFILMFSSSVLAFYKLQKLDIISHTISFADDILLFTCLPFIFLYAMACTIPFVGDDRWAFVLLNILQIVQAVLQTALISDGLRRCSNSSSLQNSKPGRELIIFLVVSNLALWLLQTFQIKSKGGNDFAYDFYGMTLWTLLSHFTLPFVLFYRFHSSVCLADMWIEAYNMEQKH